MSAIPLFDPTSLAIVLLGTVVATLLRCGWADARLTSRALGQLFGRSFDAVHARAELAVQVQEIEEDGLLRAVPHHFGDGEFDEMTDALIRTRSIQALHESHEDHRARRIEASRRAVVVLVSAAELSPVFGLVGTLVALGRLSSTVASTGNFAGAIGMAVATTLYGLVLANFLFAPLAAMISRRAEAEDRAREGLIAWLSAAIEGSCKRDPEQPRHAA
ncbi:MAG TPA: MotA/TolQ/ExbB proton channel family protein [Croceibacterium sp.]|nr:MotA/TolQ/ExbB proton channel family protein [Croceibacterium sp.]